MASGGSLTGDDVRQAVFGKPPVGKRGYDEDQVDAFMERVAAALDGFGSLTAAEVHNVIFSKPPLGRRGYDEQEVDAMLDLAASALGQPAGTDAQPPATTSAVPEPLSGYQLRQADLPHAPIGTRGYDRRQVDEYLERLATTLDRSGASLPSDELRRVPFPLTSGLRRGYRVEDVDALLDRVRAELRRRSAGW